MKKFNSTPEGKAIRKRVITEAWANDPTRGERMAIAANQRWKDPKIKSKMLKGSVKGLPKALAATKAIFADPVLKAARVELLRTQRAENPDKYNNAAKAGGEKLKALWADPVWRAKLMATRQKTMYSNPVWRKKAGDGGKGHKPWNKGETKATHKTLAKQSKKMIGNVYGPAHRRCWYRSGRRKVQMRSYWEVACAHWYDAKGMQWEYEPRYFHIGLSDRYLGHTYTPDFHLLDTDTWEEVKGLEPAEFKAKFRRFKQRYPSIKITMVRKATLQKRKVLDKHGRPCMPDGTLLIKIKSQRKDS